METKKNGIEGKVVAITGASSGIGLTTARLLAGYGASVVLGARSKDKIEAVAAEIEKAGGKALAVVMDVTKPEMVDQFVAQAVQHFGKLDVMINNAGLMAFAPLDKRKIDEWNAMIDINIKGVLYGIAAALPQFEKQNSGHFITISSVAGITTSGIGSAVYTGTKWAVRAITDSLRQEVAGKVRTTTLYPGAINTNLVNGTTDSESAAVVKKFYDEEAISPECIAEAIAFAISQPDDVSINDIVVRPSSQII